MLLFADTHFLSRPAKRSHANNSKKTHKIVDSPETPGKMREAS